nr:UDP-2,4-diacetamido-2,4,6-trideoxy-beta-L-altropyranose hydrolase [uncultured Tolumonas sp.]
MTTSNVLFRLDANDQIGTGHLMRCLVIADALQEFDVTSWFLCYPLPERLHQLILDKKHSLLCPTDIDHEFALIAQLQPDWIVVDHYALDAEWERKARPLASHLLVLDDLADRPHVADLLLDQGPLRTPADYVNIINPECRLLLGCRYALLRKEYKQLQRTSCQTWQKGLICFGGADPAHATLSTVKSLDKIQDAHQLSWTVVAGAANSDWPLLQQWQTETALNVTLLPHYGDMATLMNEHDFSIGAAGGMTWERCCIGLPAIVIPIAENQKFNDDVLAHFQLCERLTLSDLSIPEKLATALQDLKINADSYFSRGQTFIDGDGVPRLIEYILKGNKPEQQELTNENC